eukprot:scaffold49596_cov41-Prasinocladus_malaysianus.AAC.2
MLANVSTIPDDNPIAHIVITTPVQQAPCVQKALIPMDLGFAGEAEKRGRKGALCRPGGAGHGAPGARPGLGGRGAGSARGRQASPQDGVPTDLMQGTGGEAEQGAARPISGRRAPENVSLGRAAIPFAFTFYLETTEPCIHVSNVLFVLSTAWLQRPRAGRQTWRNCTEQSGVVPRCLKVLGF